MTKIKKLVDNIKEELCGAKSYAEHYVEQKAKGNSQWANRFKEMSQDELNHATYLHELTISEIEELSKVITPPNKMLEKWEKIHSEYVEEVAWIKQMLSL